MKEYGYIDKSLRNVIVSTPRGKHYCKKCGVIVYDDNKLCEKHRKEYN